MINRSILDALQNISRLQSSLEIIQQNRSHIEQVAQNHSLTVAYPLISEAVKTIQIYHDMTNPLLSETLQAFVEATEQQHRLLEAAIQAIILPDLMRNTSLFRTSQKFASTWETLGQTMSATPLVVPTTLLKSASMDVFYHTKGLQILPIEGETVQEREERLSEIVVEEASELVATVQNELEQWLSDLHPSLLAMWLGARQTLSSTNPDKVRQIMVSLRTLLDRLTMLLAPDEAMRAWSTETQYYQPDKKTPSGRGRIFYICRHISGTDSSFAHFLDADVKASVSLWITFNKLHQLEPTLSQVQLTILVERVEAVLRLLFRALQAQAQ